MIYQYKAISQTGETIEGFFEGENEADVLAMLKGNRYIPISIKKDIEAEAKVDLFSKPVKKKDLAIFCRQFYTMLNAGMGITSCLDILGKQSENKTLMKALKIVHENVQKGATLSESMGKHTKIFPLLLINMIQAGEVSGNLDTIMERMALHFEKENKLESQIKSAMIYPIILALVSIAVVIFLLIAVMPTFIGMFESSGQALPMPTQILMKLSGWLTEFWYIFLGGVIIMVGGFVFYKKTPAGQITLDLVKLKIPIVKDTNIKIITSRFTRTLSTLMSSGIPLLESIEIVGKVLGNKVVQKRLEKSIEDIRQGATLSRAVSDVSIFPSMLDSMIKVGEESGALDDILYKTADFYDDEVEVALQRLTTLMEPLMIVVMAVVIGFIVLAMALPMFDMVNTI
ncbi:MAG TPA: type II secretion system F family protein [Epulopiscium sp.]|nr:type II secretion system F family protein [Candidatus Epulonipiscium sp.]